MALGDPIGMVIKAFDPATNYATEDVTGGLVPVYDYNDSTTETKYFLCWMNGGYDDTSDIRTILPWKFTTFVGSQTCDWEVSFAFIEDDNYSIETLVFATAQTKISTEASAAGELKYEFIDFTNAQADAVKKNAFFILRVVRDASGGTASPGDAELLWPIFYLAE